MKNRKVIFFSAFKYVVPTDYEHFFEDLAAKGWHPVKVGQWSSIAMHFEKSEPNKYRYVVDAQSTPKKGYKQTYEEFGWEYVGQMASMYVWRAEYSDVRPESFSDAPSREERNKRFYSAISVAFTIFLVGALAFAAGALFSNLTSSDQLQFGLAAALFSLIALLLGVVMRKVKKNIDR